MSQNKKKTNENQTAHRLVEEHAPDLVTATTPEQLAELRAWYKKLPSERTGPPPHTAPWPTRKDESSSKSAP